MNLSELNKWRARIPFVVLTLATAPWILVQFDDIATAKWAQGVVVYPAAVLLAYLYLEFEIRDKFWSREINSHLGQQIRETLLGLAPRDLEITDQERSRLKEWELFKTLTGVFWEAVERDDQLTKLKGHFYSNGIRYTTAIDVALLGAVTALAYQVAGLLLNEDWYFVSACVLMVMAFLSGLVFVPRRRAAHLRLSEEQLDLLARNQKEYVRDRISTIVLDWRREGVLG